VCLPAHTHQAAEPCACEAWGTHERVRRKAHSQNTAPPPPQNTHTPPPQPQRIKDKYNPGAADLRKYKAAKAAGPEALARYWAGQGERLRELTGDPTPPPVAAAS
jgi:hypothetical protein